MCLLPSHLNIAHFYVLKVMYQEEGFIDHGFDFMHKSLEQNIDGRFWFLSKQGKTEWKD